MGSRSDRYGRGVFIAGSLCCYTLGMCFLARGGSVINSVVIKISIVLVNSWDSIDHQQIPRNSFIPQFYS
jgi:hypothetical protein